MSCHLIETQNRDMVGIKVENFWFLFNKEVCIDPINAVCD